jgi:tRNA modification GTPase
VLSLASMYIADTIVAPATAPGTGAVAIVRISGPRAIEIIRAIFRPAHPGEIAPRMIRLGDVVDPATGASVDRAMAIAMPQPSSLTGEDVVEIQCHGGQFIVRRIVALATALGARLAEPGEFTRRAFLNGRVDLAEAEAVADLVSARSDNALAQALAHLSGALSERVTELRKEVISIRAHLEVEIDFSDEDIRLPSRREIAAEIERLIAGVAILHDSFARGLLMRDGVRATIIGKTNAGKSSLLNLLLGADRAIVTPIAGTTRDVIEDSIQLGPYAIVLNDTAGIRDLECADPVERIGIERTMTSARDADLLIAMFDSSRALEAEDHALIQFTEKRAGLAILNKRDLPVVTSASELSDRGLELPILPLSAIDLEDAAPLRAELTKIIEALVSNPSPVPSGPSPVISRERLGEGSATPSTGEVAISRGRHRDALASALGALKNARESALAPMPPEIVAVDISAAADALGSITGEVSSEDVLDAIFRDFCIGK